MQFLARGSFKLINVGVGLAATLSERGCCWRCPRSCLGSGSAVSTACASLHPSTQAEFVCGPRGASACERPYWTHTMMDTNWRRRLIKTPCASGATCWPFVGISRAVCRLAATRRSRRWLIKLNRTVSVTRWQQQQQQPATATSNCGGF